MNTGGEGGNAGKTFNGQIPNFGKGGEDSGVGGSGGSTQAGGSQNDGGVDAQAPEPCGNDDDCDDDSVCTTDTCDDGVCTNEDTLDVDDDDPCTDDSCDPDTGAVHTPIDMDDDDACTVDSCDSASGDVAHDPIDVDDSDPCTADNCDPDTGEAHDLCLCDTTNVCIDQVVDTFEATPNSAIVDMTTTTSTIQVSGLTGYVLDVNVVTEIAHGDPSDLVITLTSPTGTEVLLSSLNGLAATGAFNGTVWDDSANTPVTEYPFNPGTLASPLTAEEALAAFLLEDPNGTWTLSVSDTYTGTQGTLNAWSLQVLTADPFPTLGLIEESEDVNLAITDFATVSSTITLPESASGQLACWVAVYTDIEHTAGSDLDIVLVSPNGKRITLTTDNGAIYDNVFADTWWVDNGGTAVTDYVFSDLVAADYLVPESAMGALIGDPYAGDWTLEVTDDATVDTGTFVEWAVHVEPCVRPED